ncbi:MAG: isoaspartyl peptidase/L-asparaginase family protein [Methylocella sp.]
MTPPGDFVLAVHGGAGVIPPEAMTRKTKNALRSGLRTSLRAGRRILQAGGTALDAVTNAVVALEDDPLFNAGRGAVFTSNGQHEMDAAVMDGRNRMAGAVAGVMGPRNPVIAARAVMEKSSHVMLIGEGAMRFCREHGVPFASRAYFYTEARRRALLEELERRRTGAPDAHNEAARHGTVGAVARDRQGNLAAATSTGGMTAKLPGRVGDSPIFGAGTWADNETCAVSATGAGEFFIRWAVAHEIAARIRHRGDSLERAAKEVVNDLGRIGGRGGIIAVDRTGKVALPFNCEGMYRGTIRAGGVALTAIHQEELCPTLLGAVIAKYQSLTTPCRWSRVVP